MLLCYLRGGLPINLSNAFPPRQESSLKDVPENSNWNYKPAFLFICQSAVADSEVKPKHKTLLVEWVLRGLWSKMEIRSLLKKRGGKTLTQCIVTHLKTSPCSLNVLLSANRSVHRKCKNTLYFNQGA